MPHDEIDEITMNTDDMSVLRVLLHTIKGISPVAGDTLDFVPIADDDSDM